MARARRPARRGLLTRLASLVLGAGVALGAIAAMQVPLLGRAATARVSLGALHTGAPVGDVDWPLEGSAAVLIPSLGVATDDNDQVVPIASLAKMMTAYVVLEHLPLSGDDTGPCLIINDADYATFLHAEASGQSNVAVAVGEQICESQLLEGLLVGSANNFALLLAVMADHSVPAFVAEMNETAASMGLAHTHYVEPSGYKPGSVSTALEQARLAARLMAIPAARAIVALTSVDLPVAGDVTTYTPYLGVDGVVGVKSGRTDAAGGCVVMAMQYAQGASTETLYSVVLDQRGGDLLGPAGEAALALATSARNDVVGLSLARGTPVGDVGWGARRARLVLGASAHVWWWSGGGEP
ncbi:MAG: D-alanyl-D-alanine carboxypeptidase family protein, partial [Acidimicrobiales bacterium]